ncbi:hypothetical protein [Sediminibacter sp. Hel_I_10]|uniref:hypothetical protein n=1 Tax=Sediminibacter sp. Hel_I_10 TaxID=1392490 RepID=UPI0004795220|nr:hypothetical protein [Sediminibacter sp. Hel_I_10]
MKTTLKQKVLTIFLIAALKVRFNDLLQVLLDHKDATPFQKRFYNAGGYSPKNLDSLEYDVKKLFHITEADIRSAKKEERKAEDLEIVLDISQELQETINAIDLETANYHKEIVPLANDISEAVKVELESRKKEDLIKFIQDYKKVEETFVNPFLDAPEDVKQNVKLRDEFPFLSADDCPDELKVLVADKMTAYGKFKDSREEIKKLLEAGASEDEIFELAKVSVENFELNLDIYDELNYYKNEGEILGKHPIFEMTMLQKKVDELPGIKLSQRQKTLRANISRDNGKLEKMDDGDAKTKFADKLNLAKKELELVDTRIAKIS